MGVFDVGDAGMAAALGRTLLVAAVHVAPLVVLAAITKERAAVAIGAMLLTVTVVLSVGFSAGFVDLLAIAAGYSACVRWIDTRSSQAGRRSP